MVELQTTWNWLIVAYLFLGGLAAGTFCTMAALWLVGRGHYTRAITAGAWTAVIALAAGLLALLAEVEKPFQALMMWQSFSNLSSWMALGAWLILIAFVVFILTALFLTDRTSNILGELWKPLRSGRDTIIKVLVIVGAVLSVGVAAYTGVLLGAAPSIPLWNSWLLPILFTVSAFDTGVAAVLIYINLLEKGEDGQRASTLLERVVIVLVCIEAIVLTVFIISMLQGDKSEVIAVTMVIEGQLSFVFWILMVGLGLAVPLIIAIIQQFMKGRHVILFPLVGAFCALVGGVSLRYIIVSAGIHGVLYSPVAEQAMKGVFQIIS